MKLTFVRSLLLACAVPSAALLITLMSTSNTAAASNSSDQSKYFVYIGSYGKGVHGYRFDETKMTLEPLGLVGEVTNPSFLATDRDYKNLYAVSELEGKENGSVASFALDRGNGSLRFLNTVGSGGRAPCHLAVDHTGKMLIVANYSTGGVSSYPIESGRLGEMASLMTAQGSGFDKKRQEGSHAHEAVISKDNSRVYVPDLGLDEIRIYRLDPAHAKLVPNDPPSAKDKPGFGPRHMAFDPQEKFAYVVNELQPFISVFSHDSSNGGLTLIQTVSTLPAGFTKENSGAEIRMAPSGKFVYASNRGHDSIQVFAINTADGTLQHVQTISTEGHEPRGFDLDPTGRYLFAGNQKSNNLVIFKVDRASGKLTSTGKRFDMSSPVDVLFVPAA